MDILVYREMLNNYKLLSYDDSETCDMNLFSMFWIITIKIFIDTK